MKWRQTILFFCLICCNTIMVTAQKITVDDAYTAQQLVENVLVNSDCAQVSKFTPTADTFTVGQNSYGYFNNAGGSFPFSEGVVLSTWSSKNAVGPFILEPSGFSNNGGGSSSWGGDSDLNQAIGINSINATVLEFDFTPLTNFLSFDYIFASNEYKANRPCDFSDGFAFLIKENIPGSVYQNLAVIPGTQTPVSSVTINPLIAPNNVQSGCPAENETYFNGFNSNSSPINYAGQTIVMKAKTTVDVGKSYHIKLVIADGGTRYFDSAVFLKAGSFAPKIDLGIDRLSATNPVCFGESYTIDTKLSPSYRYKWYKDGSLMNDETKPTLEVKEIGTYKVEVDFTPSTCQAKGEIRIEFAPQFVLADSNLAQCDDNNDGITIFDLTKMDAIIKNSNPSLGTVVYYESKVDAIATLNPILNPKTYSNKIALPPLFARVTNSFGCANYAQLTLTISNNSIAVQDPIPTCDGDSVQDGFYEFDLNVQVTPQILKGLPAGMLVEYYSNTTDAIAQQNPLPNIYKNTTAYQEIIQARILNGSDCFGIVPMTLLLNTFAPPDFQDENATLCSGSKVDLSVASSFSSYQWDTGEKTEGISVITPGTYSVTVTNANTCSAVKKFSVTESRIATITAATINDFAGNDNAVLLDYTGIGTQCEFSIDGANFQDSPLFTGVPAGKYLGYAKDKNGCGLSAPYPFYIIDYPRFFTPNGDNYNDVWKIENLDLFPAATLTIYDRYGKALYEMNIVSTDWDGTLNGVALPPDDYWFHLHFDDGKIIKGHFSLKR